MVVVVIGGEARTGSKLVRKLRETREEVLAASPGTGVNRLTGKRLAEAPAGGG